MERVTATRTELLARRVRLGLARLGRDLLQEKRDQLMEEFRKVADVVLAEGDALHEAAATSRTALALVEAAEGPEALRSAALAGRSGIELQARAVTVMGVRIADIAYTTPNRARTARGYALSGTSAGTDHVAAAFEHQLDLILQYAGRELRLRRLAAEIGKTTRRVNALEFVVIPRLEDEQALIQSILEERERQDHFRLKRVKTQKGSRSKVEVGA